MPAPPDPLRDLYKSLSGKGALPLDPDDPYYVRILQAAPEKDPILMLWQRLDWSESESVNLLTGFRGNGKSTELRRLKQLLEEKSGAKVLLINMADFLLMTKPLELSDFVLSLMTALGQAVEQDTGLKALTHGYWERLQRFLTSEVELEKFELDLKEVGAPAKLGLKLKNEPDFKERIQKHLRGHLSRLIEDAQGYVVGLVDAIRKEAADPDLKVVLLVDSVEQLRGVGTEAAKVHDSVVNLFSGQAASLAFPKLHLVYTIPLYLLALSQNLGRTLGGHPIVSWPNVHVRNPDGVPDGAGLAIMDDIIARRHAGWPDIIPPETLRRLAICTGGDLRDFFRLVRECVIALSTARLAQPDAVLSEQMVKRVEEQLRNELLPIAEDDARWLARIHGTKDASLPSTDALPALARFLDGNLIMNYLNGEPWNDIHPLLVEEIRRYLVPGGSGLTGGPFLNPEGEAAWLRVKQHLEWCDSFALVFVFSDQPAVVAILRERLAAIYRARVTGLEIPMPGTPDELLDGLLPRLLHPPLYQQALDAPVWLDLTRLPGGATEAERRAWGEAALRFLARLNEQREPLRRALTKPLILVLPLGEKARIKALAPDLWAIRHFSLETGPWLVPRREQPPADPPARPEPFPLGETNSSLVHEWRRLGDKGGSDRGALLAGGRAFDALLRRGRTAEARETADWLAETARARLADHRDDPDALRDLSVSLNNVGNTDRALGDLEQARAAFAESLDISRRLLARLGETPEALRDLSVSLDNVGNTDRALGDLEQARAAFAESLDIRRRLLARLGETPEALRDLSVSLNNVGNTDRALGDWEQARAAFAESLDIRRRLLARLGETPEALRDLSVSLDNVGNTDRALGDWEQARAAFAESLDIRRRLLARLGETPEALRDLSVSLNNVGNTDRALGDWEQARAAFAEGLEIARRLAQALPRHPEYRDLPTWFEKRLGELGAARAGDGSD